MAVVIKDLDGVATEVIHSAFVKAFEDYAEPLSLSLSQLQHMLQRRGYVPAMSFGAFDGGEIVGFILNGTGIWNGRRTAYDTGTATLQAYRQQGIARRIFDESIPVLKRHGISQYLLEVIKVNTNACDLYKKAGFEVVRELDYYVSPKEAIDVDEYGWKYGYEIKEITSPDWDLLRSFWDFEPSWQNGIEAMQRSPQVFRIMGVYDAAHQLVGYGIVEPATGDVPQFAIAHDHRCAGLGKYLFHNLVAHITSEQIKVINADATGAAFRHFVEGMGLMPGYGQYEMISGL